LRHREADGLRSVEAVTAEVLALGSHVEVIAPAELGEHVAEQVRRTAERYES
jgi:predicted DNA-binding transcriptional regulator YafY